ncbi:HAD family hydrolase [Crenothrix polyspora]|uniref:HAD-superfamily hydrolase, subfamily IA, variant 1 n=1 Tax=Crenothrix polyspora TaxID=360316 RepID=A0A1R4HJU1_9GAMM|nr:HAD-IA family hydrolase [Crenothrix polyspora]SJM96489.1 HAD-superfamily hydrolase, subfamily IA, variant 1 [Crenothrix polyspora]
MNKRFDLIIFDWDGTLINSIDWIAHCLQKAGRVHGFAVPELQDAKNVIGLSIHNALLTLFPDADGATLDKLVACYNQEYFSKQLSRVDFFTGVYDMLLALKQSGYQLAVATGKTRAGLDKVLTATDTGDLFCITRCADETASKPDPKMLHEIMQHTKVAQQRTLMVGDSVHDLHMAQNAQIASIAVLCGSHTEDFLQQYHPLACLMRPTELLNFI